MVPLLVDSICGGIRLYMRRGGIWVVYTERFMLLEMLRLMRGGSLFRMSQLFDIVGTDKFSVVEVTYGVLSVGYGEKVYFRVLVPYGEVVVSTMLLFKSANWLERELWDMFGVFVEGHVDLRRILTDYGFEGNPLRKSFPMVGYYEVRYDDMEKRIVMENISMMQEFRVFEFSRPWS